MSDRKVGERELREALRDVPDDAAARERSWRVVQSAFAARERRPQRSHRALALVAAALVPVVVAGVAVGAPRWVQDAFTPGEDRARPALVRVPGGGSLLVQSGGSTWVVSADGSRRRLGRFSGASWSPRGLFVVAWRGRELTALEPDGGVRWSLSASGRVTQASWSPVDGYRIAYVAGAALRVVFGDGTNDRRYGPVRAVAPAWRPDAAHVLAYVDRRERVNVVAADSGRRLWRTPPLAGVTRLAWAPDGRRLVAVVGGRLYQLDPQRRSFTTASKTATALASTGVEHVAWSPHGRRTLALIRTGRGGDEVVVVRRWRERVLFTAPGRLDGLAWSPDGTRLLVSWPEADQWLFLRPHGGRLVAVANIARQFSPGATRPPFPGAVQWCCAAP